MKKALLLIFLHMLASNANAASFDCKSSNTEIEKKVCSNAELSSLDETLNSHYTIAKIVSTNFNELKESQVWWLKKRNVCQSVECLLEEYDKRIDNLTYALVSSEIDFMAAAHFMLKQRGVKLGITAEKLEEYLDYGSTGWGWSDNKRNKAVMPLNIYPIECKLDDYDGTKACKKSLIFSNYVLRFYTDESHVLKEITLNNGLVLLEK